MIANSPVKFGTSGARGLVSDMTDALCYAYAAAFLQAVTGNVVAVVLGHDLRPSSPRIAAACAAAIRDIGAEVIYVGALPTPAIAYFAAQQGLAALVVTGSHIPFDRNGIKFYRPDGEISKADETAMLAAQIPLLTEVAPLSLPVPDPRATASYVQRYVDFFGASALTGMHIAVYEHSSVGRDILRDILQALGAQVISLGRTDVFVPIDTEAVRSEDVAQAKAWAQSHTFDAILSTDGDADRPLIGDENGQWLRGDVVGILCAQFLQAEAVVTPVSSNTALEKCQLFNQVLRTRIGSPYVIAGMESISANSVVGYEANGGFLLGSAVLLNGNKLAALPTRDAVLPMLALLSLARQQACKVSELAQRLPKRFTHSDRIQNFAIENSRILLEKLRADASLASALMDNPASKVTAMDTTDGLRVTFASGDIVHLRPSGNAPELRCYAEADSPELAERLCLQCLARIQSGA